MSSIIELICVGDNSVGPQRRNKRGLVTYSRPKLMDYLTSIEGHAHNTDIFNINSEPGVESP